MAQLLSLYAPDIKLKVVHKNTTTVFWKKLVHEVRVLIFFQLYKHVHMDSPQATLVSYTGIQVMRDGQQARSQNGAFKIVIINIF